MKRLAGGRAITAFALRFCITAVILVPLWWLVAPAYGWLLAQGCGIVLRDALGLDITAAAVNIDGILNTGTQLTFFVGSEPASMPLMKLVTNLPPFFALMLSTPGMPSRIKIKRIAMGTAILCLGHGLFVVAALRYARALERAPELPTAATQFLLSLPFLLWIVFAYLPTSGAPKAEEERPS